MCAVIHYLLFFYKILAKYSPKRTKLHHFLKFSRGNMPPNPPSKRVASARAAWPFAPCKYPHFYKKNLNPPPRNEILDTPLCKSNYSLMNIIILWPWMCHLGQITVTPNGHMVKPLSYQ